MEIYLNYHVRLAGHPLSETFVFYVVNRIENGTLHKQHNH